MASEVVLLDELINTFNKNCQFNYDHTNDSLLPSLESNPYSLQCLIDWVCNIEQNDKIIELDFDKIENDIEQLQATYGSKCKGLFYPNWQPMKYTYNYDNYKAKYYDNNIYEINKQNVKNIYMKLFADKESIIHYILYNKSFLFKLPKPDINKQRSKLDKIKEINGDSMMKLNMKQSIYILRLLLFKYEIISPDALFEDDCTTFSDIEEKIRETVIKHKFEFHDIRKVYLDLICDIYSISTNQSQPAIINIFSFEEDNEKQWYHVNFCDDCDCIRENRSIPSKLSMDVTKELLFRGIPPLQITNREHIRDYECDTYDDLSITEQSKLFHDCFNRTMQRTMDDEYMSIKAITAATVPFIICNIANSVKTEMYNLLDKYLKDNITKDCIQSILDFIYIDWNQLLPEIKEENIRIKANKFLNYVVGFNVEEMDETEKNKVFNKPFLTKEMASFLLKDISDSVQEHLLMTDVFVCRDWFSIHNFGLKVFYELVKLQRLKTEILEKFINLVIMHRNMNEEERNIFVDIVSIHVLDANTLKDESFMKDYRNKILDYIDKLYNYTVYFVEDYRGGQQKKSQFVDYIVENYFPSDFLS